MHAELEEYPQAITRFEQVADHSLTSPLTKYSVKEYWLRSGMCALAMKVDSYKSLLNWYSVVQDTITAKRNMTKYSNQDASFPSTREAKFLSVLIEAVEGGDPEAFTAAVVEFDQVTKLDNWKTNILLKIKRGLQEPDSIL